METLRESYEVADGHSNGEGHRLIVLPEEDAQAHSSLEGSLPRNRFISKEKCCLGIPLLSAALVMTPSCCASFA
jgi:hypothetical protein